MTLKKEFGKKIKSLREKRKLSQLELAELVGVEVLAISQIENGKQFVKAETLESLKNALEISYPEMFDFDGNEPRQNSRLKSIIVHLKDINDRGLEYILENIKVYKKIHNASRLK